MHRVRTSAINTSLYYLANKTFLASSFAVPPFPKRPTLGYRNISISASSMSGAKQLAMPENAIEQVELLTSVNDAHGGVIVNIEQPMDSGVFAPLLKASISEWRNQEKKGVWLKLPIEHVNLIESAVKEGFRYHHAEPNYLMLVYWIPETADTLPANASHRVGIGAFVVNSTREVLVVQEKNGRFKGTGVWKFPTGVVDEGEDICAAAIREVKEETGIETEFVEVLAFRQSHKSYFSKSDLFFVCMLQPRSFDIQKQNLEIEAAQWMSVEDYIAQPFVQKQELFSSVAKICLAKSNKDYVGFSPYCSTTSSGKRSFLYYNNQDLKHIGASDKQQ